MATKRTTSKGAPSGASVHSGEHDAATAAFLEIECAHKEGRSPDSAALALIAAAVPALMKTGDARTRAQRFGEALGIEATGRSGRKEMTAGDALTVYRAVGFMLQLEERFIAEGMSKRSASSRAVAEAVVKFNLSKSRAQHWRTAHRKFCMDMLEDARREHAKAVANHQELMAILKNPRRTIRRK